MLRLTELTRNSLLIVVYCSNQEQHIDDQTGVLVTGHWISYGIRLEPS